MYAVEKGGRPGPEIIVFAKPAQLTGSRLARRVGDADAALVNHRVLSRILHHLRGVEMPVSVALSGETPDYADIAERSGAKALMLPHGDLGRQLARALRQRRNGTILIDSDAPSLDAIIVRHAARVLGLYDIIIGPNWSGGAYLIALRSPYHVVR